MQIFMNPEPIDDLQIVNRVAATIRKEFGQNRFRDHSASDIAMSAYGRYLKLCNTRPDYRSIEDASDLARVLTYIARFRALTLTQRKNAAALVEDVSVELTEDDILKDFRAFNLKIRDERTQVVVRCKIEGMAIPQIAEEAGIAEITVRRLWGEYCDQLRSALRCYDE